MCGCLKVMVQAVSGLAGAEATPEGFVPSEDTWRSSLHLQERERALQQVLHARCLLLSMSMLNTKWKKPSRSTGKASIVWCHSKEASSWVL